MSFAQTVIRPLARRLLPAQKYQPLREAYHYYRQQAQLWADPRWAANIEQLRRYHNCHVGQRCFIIGNGPSLKHTDLTRLKNEFTFGLNRIYLLFDELGFSTSYYASVNSLVIEQCADDIARLAVPKFISWSSRDNITFTPNMMFVRPQLQPAFQPDVTQPLWPGSTVTYVALQIAYFMGFKQAILIGVDHNFETKGDPDKTVVSQGADPNHFSPDYFGKGFRWQLPNLANSEIAYQLARLYYERTGREIIDATVGGNLHVFPKIDYNTLFT